MLAFMFVETMINELFEDAADPRGPGCLEPLGAEVIRDMSVWWTTKKENGCANDRTSTLAKYKEALKLAGKGNVGDFGSWDDAVAMKALRDAIAHYRPSWSDDEGRPKDLEEQLAHRSEPSTLVAGAWWSLRALSAGCAEWCCATAESVADEFSDRMGIEPNYLQVRNKS